MLISQHRRKLLEQIAKLPPELSVLPDSHKSPVPHSSNVDLLEVDLHSDHDFSDPESESDSHKTQTEKRSAPGLFSDSGTNLFAEADFEPDYTDDGFSGPADLDTDNLPRSPEHVTHVDESISGGVHVTTVTEHASASPVTPSSPARNTQESESISGTSMTEKSKNTEHVSPDVSGANKHDKNPQNSEQDLPGDLTVSGLPLNVSQEEFKKFWAMMKVKEAYERKQAETGKKRSLAQQTPLSPGRALSENIKRARLAANVSKSPGPPDPTRTVIITDQVPGGLNITSRKRTATTSRDPSPMRKAARISVPDMGSRPQVLAQANADDSTMNPEQQGEETIKTHREAMLILQKTFPHLLDAHNKQSNRTLTQSLIREAPVDFLRVKPTPFYKGRWNYLNSAVAGKHDLRVPTTGRLIKVSQNRASGVWSVANTPPPNTFSTTNEELGALIPDYHKTPLSLTWSEASTLEQTSRHASQALIYGEATAGAITALCTDMMTGLEKLQEYTELDLSQLTEITQDIMALAVCNDHSTRRAQEACTLNVANCVTLKRLPIVNKLPAETPQVTKQALATSALDKVSEEVDSNGLPLRRYLFDPDVVQRALSQHETAAAVQDRANTRKLLQVSKTSWQFPHKDNNQGKQQQQRGFKQNRGGRGDWNFGKGRGRGRGNRGGRGGQGGNHFGNKNSGSTGRGSNANNSG